MNIIRTGPRTPTPTRTQNDSGVAFNQGLVGTTSMKGSPGYGFARDISEIPEPVEFIPEKFDVDDDEEIPLYTSELDPEYDSELGMLNLGVEEDEFLDGVGEGEEGEGGEVDPFDILRKKLLAESQLVDGSYDPPFGLQSPPRGRASDALAFKNDCKPIPILAPSPVRAGIAGVGVGVNATPKKSVCEALLEGCRLDTTRTFSARSSSSSPSSPTSSSSSHSSTSPFSESSTPTSTSTSPDGSVELVCSYPSLPYPRPPSHPSFAKDPFLPSASSSSSDSKLPHTPAHPDTHTSADADADLNLLDLAPAPASTPAFTPVGTPTPRLSPSLTPRPGAVFTQARGSGRAYSVLVPSSGADSAAASAAALSASMDEKVGAGFGAVAVAVAGVGHGGLIGREEQEQAELEGRVLIGKVLSVVGLLCVFYVLFG